MSEERDGREREGRHWVWEKFAGDLTGRGGESENEGGIGFWKNS